MTEDEFEDIIERLLEVGVPPTAIAKAFSLDVFVVKEKMAQLRVARYGAAELSEAMTNIQWVALEQITQMMVDAPYSQRYKLITGILGKTMSLTARQNPETMGNVRAEVLELMRGLAAPDDDFAGVDTGAFVAAETAAAPQVDENQNQGSLHNPVGSG